MRLLRDALVWLFACIGVLATVGAAAFYFLFDKFDDPLDRTEVAAVIPAPNGDEAAVVYLHYDSNASRAFIQVKRVRKPFPDIGASINTQNNVLTLSGALLPGWQVGVATDASARATKLVEISWKGSQLLLCPAENAGLVAFNGGYYENSATLCFKRP